MASTSFIEQAYLAYFGRPADPGGLIYFQARSEAQVMSDFFYSAESQALYNGLTPAQQINQIYNTLFGHDADAAGLTYWGNEIVAGRVSPPTAAIAILRGALGADKVVVDNKLAASHAFTAHLDTPAEINGFVGTPALDSSRVFLHSVTSTPATPAQVDAAITTAIGAGHLVVNAPSVLEGNTGVNNQLVFTLTLSAAQTTDTVINFATQTNGTALPGVDFVAATGTVTIPAFQTTVTVPVTVIGDNVIQPDQTVKVLFSSDAIVSSVTATGTIINDDVPVVLPETFILTTGQDVFTGNGADDLFLATGSTLQLGDILVGGGGNDELSVSISGRNGLNTGFSADGIETIKVKSLADRSSTLDLSDVHGVTTLESNETSGASLSFVDIQSVNNTDISITDTSETHNFNYDTNAFTAGIDAVDLRLAEVNGSQINFSTGSASLGVEQINIDSQDNPNPIAGDSDATVNTVSDLNVGNKLEVVNIKGNADLTVGAPLDINVRLVDAHTLDANLTLDLSNSNDGNPASSGDDATTVEEIVYVGALQNDHVEFGSTDNAKNVTLGNGNDWVRTGTGVAVVDGGNGNDTIITGALNDLVIAGAGNDVVIDAGADNATTGWTTRYVAGGNSFALGLGDDSLTVTGSGNNTADLGAGNDVMFVGAAGEDSIVDGHQSVTAGDGNDSVTLLANGWANVDLGAGNDSLYIERDRQVIADSTVTAGAGDDSVSIHSNGNVHGTGGDGNDSFYIVGNGGHTLDLGAGNDGVTIVGDGTHNITLGSGDDYLDIEGARNTAGNADNGATDGITVINAGDGNDTVYVAAEHYLGADLGAGNDAIHLRAQDLTVDDTVAGGAGKDSIWLSNQSESSADGRVLASETIHTTGFETYELLNSNITLKLTDRMITTAENQDLTVSTVNSNSTDLPGVWSTAANGWIYPLVQGMTNAQFDVLVAQTRAGDFDNTPNAPMLRSAAYYDSLPAQDRLPQAEADLRAYISKFVEIDNTDTNHDGDTTDALDQLFFLAETGVQTIDMTGITTPEYKFTLDGGNVADVVIGNDATINGQMTLNYNFGGSSATAAGDRTALSVEDKLVVMGGAEISAADLRNVTGLENIVLKGGGNGVPQTWGIELTDRVIDQTTGSAALEIFVDPNVEAGSKLYITLDPSIVNASNDVVIHKNTNVQVYINGNLVTEPQLGVTDFNPGTYSITVVNELIFTANSDHLVGTNGDDKFIANQLAHIQAGDSANGNGGFDTLQLNFAVANGANTLQEMFNDASLTSIERIEFNTENNVTFGGIGLGYASSLQELATNEGNDTLTLMRQGLSYELNAGDDSISLLAFGAGEDNVTTVDGGAGSDTVNGSSGNDELEIRDVESVNGGAGFDSVTMLNANNVVFWNVEHIEGSNQWPTPADGITADGTANIYVDGNWGNDTIAVGLHSNVTNATVLGGDEADSIDVSVSGNATVQGDDGNIWDNNDTITVHAFNAAVSGQGGNDVVNVTVNSTATVAAGTGNDVVTVYAENTTVDGGDGNDNIDVTSAYNGGGGSISDATVRGGDGNDTMRVVAADSTTVDGGTGDDSITVSADAGPGGYGGWGVANITGDSGNDTIVLNYSGSVGDFAVPAVNTVDGGSGNDSITVSNTHTGTSIVAGTGNDTVTIGDNAGTTTITGGEGNDTIHLKVSETGSADTLVFGNITYNGLQVENFNSQGTDVITGFNWEPSGPTAGAQDVLNFSAFNGPIGPVVNTNALGTVAGQVNVVETTNNAFILTNANWATSGFTMANNSKGVLIIGKDTDGTDGLNHFDVYYVQDVDSGADVAVKVNLVGTIDSATNVGLTTITGANFA